MKNSMPCFEKLGNQEALHYEIRHIEQIENLDAILSEMPWGLKSTADEKAFVTEESKKYPRS